jgi:hypothetical protein
MPGYCGPRKNEAPTRVEGFDSLSHFSAHLVRRSKGEGPLRVYPATPKRQSLAKLRPQFHRIHPRRRALNRVQDVESRSNEILEQGAN